ncbi:MAG: hypothetical protein IJA14_02550 [Alphaproteobacteria bacterium]|nr:hypothetical protein [Alphaproteobacteria bacterium]
MRKMLLSAICLGIFSYTSVDAGLLDKIKNSKIGQFAKNAGEKIKNSKVGQRLKNSKVVQALKKVASVQINNKATRLFGTLKKKISNVINSLKNKGLSTETVTRINTDVTNINNRVNSIQNQGVSNMPFTSLHENVESISTSLNDINEATVGLDVSTSGAVTVVNQLKGIIKQMGVTIDNAKEANQEVINAVNNSIDPNLTDEDKNQISALTSSISTSLDSIKTTTDPQTFVKDATNLKNAMTELQTRAKNLNKDNQLYQSMTASASALDYVVNRRMKMTVNEAVKSLDEMGANLVDAKLGEGADAAIDASTDAQ